MSGGSSDSDEKALAVKPQRNPSASNYRRFVRVQALVSEVLIPLGDGHPIVEVRVK